MRLPIEFLSKKSFEEKDIEIIITKNKRRKDKTIDQIIDENWVRIRNKAKLKNIVFYDSPLTRVSNIVEKNGKIIFTLGLTTFKDRIGILPDAKEFLKQGKAYMPNPLTVGTVIVTSDDKIPIEIRKSGTAIDFTAEYEGFTPPIFHEPAGFVRPSRDDNDPRNTVKNVILSEIFESKDTALRIIKNELLGVIYNTVLDETFCCFNTQIDYKWKELMRLKEDKYFCLDADKKTIENFLRKPSLYIYSYTFVNLLLFGRKRWGRSFMEELKI